MIKVIAFDFGGVLGCEADDWENTFKKVLDASALTNTEMLQIWNNHWPKLKIGNEPIKNYWIDVSKKRKVDPEKLRKTYNSSITTNNSVFEFAKSLKAKHKIIILSNDSVDWMNTKIKRFGLNSIFDNIYCSGNLGIAKPSKEIFELVLNKEEIKPEELFFIDNQENNIEASRSLGIRNFLFSNQAHAISSIQESYKDIIRNID